MCVALEGLAVTDSESELTEFIVFVIRRISTSKAVSARAVPACATSSNGFGKNGEIAEQKKWEQV
jgi:hypothetical protein